jgi:hypothetical protein
LFLLFDLKAPRKKEEEKSIGPPEGGTPNGSSWVPFLLISKQS